MNASPPFRIRHLARGERLDDVQRQALGLLEKCRDEVLGCRVSDGGRPCGVDELGDRGAIEPASGDEPHIAGSHEIVGGRQCLRRKVFAAPREQEQDRPAG